MLVVVVGAPGVRMPGAGQVAFGKLKGPLQVNVFPSGLMESDPEHSPRLVPPCEGYVVPLITPTPTSVPVEDVPVTYTSPLYGPEPPHVMDWLVYVG